MTKHSPEILMLRYEIEQSVNRLIRTPSDFEFLVGVIWERMHVTISPTTLKRLWGYIEGADVTRRSTLNILSQFLGYENWEAYLTKLHDSSPEGSNFIVSKSVQTSSLHKGNTITVSWKPDRTCTFLFLGKLQFRVVVAKNSKLQVGDTFECPFFILHEPLYIDNLIQGNNPPTPFVIGTKGGLEDIVVG